MTNLSDVFEYIKDAERNNVEILKIYISINDSAALRKFLSSLLNGYEDHIALLKELEENTTFAQELQCCNEEIVNLDSYQLVLTPEDYVVPDSFLKRLAERIRLLTELYGKAAAAVCHPPMKATLQGLKEESKKMTALIHDWLDLENLN